MNKISLIPENLNRFYESKTNTWDFKANPCLFPLFLFQYFSEKYCKQEQTEKEHSSYYSRESVYCKYTDPSLAEKYHAWFIASTTWDHVSFFLQVGKNGFKPFNNEATYAKGLIAYIHLQAFADKITISVNLETCFDFSILFCCYNIAREIDAEMKKYTLPANFLKTLGPFSFATDLHHIHNIHRLRTWDDAPNFLGVTTP